MGSEGQRSGESVPPQDRHTACGLALAGLNQQPTTRREPDRCRTGNAALHVQPVVTAEKSAQRLVLPGFGGQQAQIGGRNVRGVGNDQVDSAQEVSGQTCEEVALRHMCALPQVHSSAGNRGRGQCLRRTSERRNQFWREAPWRSHRCRSAVLLPQRARAGNPGPSSRGTRNTAGARKPRA